MSNLGTRGGRMVTAADADKVALARAGRKPANKRTRVKIADRSQRKAIVLEAAVKLVKQDPEAGLMNLKWDAIAKVCSVKTSAITARRMFQRIVDIRQAVVDRGRSDGDAAIVQQAEKFGF